MEHHEWEPGNATRYDLYFGEVSPRWYLLCWMRFGGSGGSAFCFAKGSRVHYGYLMEKMEIKEGDADGILAFLETQGVEVRYSGHHDKISLQVV